MRAPLIVIIFLAAPILLTAEVQVAAAADRPVPDASGVFEQVVPQRLLRDLYSQALSTLQEYFELDGHLPGDGSARHQGGEFRLRLYPKGKSRSQEHLSAEGSFSLAPDGEQREFRLRFKSSQHPPDQLAPNDDVI